MGIWGLTSQSNRPVISMLNRAVRIEQKQKPNPKQNKSPPPNTGLLKMISFIHVLAWQCPLPVHPRSSHQWRQRAKINSRKGRSIQAEMASFVLKDFGRGVLKNHAICGFFSPRTACAVDNASPTSITSVNASSWAVQSILPSRPQGSKVSSQTVPAICSPHPNSGRPHPKHPARPLPEARGDGQDVLEQECPTVRPSPTICFIWSLSVLDVSSSFPPLHTQLGQTPYATTRVGTQGGPWRGTGQSWAVTVLWECSWGAVVCSWNIWGCVFCTPRDDKEGMQGIP